jgi:hypothetical protein
MVTTAQTQFTTGFRGQLLVNQAELVRSHSHGTTKAVRIVRWKAVVGVLLSLLAIVRMRIHANHDAVSILYGSDSSRSNSYVNLRSILISGRCYGDRSASNQHIAARVLDIIMARWYQTGSAALQTL